MSAAIKYPPSRLQGLKPFKKGESGNPGGRPKGAYSIPHAYARLLVLSPDEFKAYEPKNSAEVIAKYQIERALETDKGYMASAIKAVQEITDRTEGKTGKAIDRDVVIRVRYDDEMEPNRE